MLEVKANPFVNNFQSPVVTLKHLFELSREFLKLGEIRTVRTLHNSVNY